MEAQTVLHGIYLEGLKKPVENLKQGTKQGPCAYFVRIR